MSKELIYDIDDEVIGCRLCGAEAFWDMIAESFIFTCPCGEIDLDILPEEYR